jgi:hypothetical protein
MGYYIDLASISIDDYKIKLQAAYLPPSRMILKERLEDRFDYFGSIGIKNVKELLQILRKKESFDELLKKTEYFSGDYLTILLRELNSIHPKPNKIKDFPGISSDTVLKLEKKGITDTFKLYDKVINADNRKELAQLTGICDSDILELTKLTDLSRIKWVGVAFAHMLYEAGIDTIVKASNANCEDLHEQINLINKERNLYKGKIGLNDIRIFVHAAKEVPCEIEY